MRQYQEHRDINYSNWYWTGIPKNCTSDLSWPRLCISSLTQHIGSTAWRSCANWTWSLQKSSRGKRYDIIESRPNYLWTLCCYFSIFVRLYLHSSIFFSPSILSTFFFSWFLKDWYQKPLYTYLGSTKYLLVTLCRFSSWDKKDKFKAEFACFCLDSFCLSVSFSQVF